jgi:DNA-binding response OmpR family regulator
MRILLVEDEVLLCESIKSGLSEHGMTVDAVGDGQEGLRLACSHLYDAVILDIMLPGMDGMELLRKLRQDGHQTPVLFLTARTSTDDKVAALNTGGDDYLTKPFAFSELLARLQAMVRRSRSATPGPLRVADLEIEPLSRRVVRAGKPIELLPREYALLEFMVRNRNQPLTRAMIADHVWDKSFDSFSNVIDVHINRLRAKVDRDFPVKLIHTIRGVGYILRDPALPEPAAAAVATVPVRA